MTLIDSMPGSLTSYFDISPPIGTTCYRIEAPNPAGCVPTAPPTPYSSSFSNTACTTVLSAADPDHPRLVIDVTPNPFSSTAIFTIEGTSQSVDFELFNMIGKKVRALYSISGPTFEVPRKNLPDGIYVYQIIGDSGFLKTGKVIIN
jgi:hypothetical protein